MYDACNETPESSLPTRDTWVLNKAIFWRLSKELKYKTKLFYFGNEGSSCMTCACVRELVKARDIGITCEHSCRNAYVVAQCVCND